MKGSIQGVDITLQKIQQILTSSVQSIYKAQGISISDIHLELIVKQMTSRAEIALPGDTPFGIGYTFELGLLRELAYSLTEQGYRPPLYQPYLMGITKFSLEGKSFLAAASFQETRKVLARAAIEGQTDWLRSIKGNVITGKLLPVGTGFNQYKFIYSPPKFADLANFFEKRIKK